MQPDQSPLDQLADIHLPDNISWWPLAPGWWIVIGLLIMAVVVFLIWRQRAKQNRYRAVAQKELARVYAIYQENRDATALLHEISVLLRRTALTAYPNTFNASIKGQAWLNWLDSVCPATKGQESLRFTGEAGQQLLTAIYQKSPQIDADLIYRASRHWLAHHRNHRQRVPGARPAAKHVEANHV